LIRNIDFFNKNILSLSLNQSGFAINLTNKDSHEKLLRRTQGLFYLVYGILFYLGFSIKVSI